MERKMRKIVLDTETTGLYPEQGHRIIEIAAIELAGRKVTQRHFHHYLDPEREVDEGAAKIHGFTWDMLRGRAKFSDIAASFLEFVGDAELIIHNAPFDMGFLNHELKLLGLPELKNEVMDTLKFARDMHPGKKNSLDALCSRYEIDNKHRSLHGALLDTELLAEVYFAMTRGQNSLLDDDSEPVERLQAVFNQDASRPALYVLRASEAELTQHMQQLIEIDKASKGNCLWKSMEEIC
jgi:DNA polymerase-3 subunit epsilon